MYRGAKFHIDTLFRREILHCHGFPDNLLNAGVDSK